MLKGVQFSGIHYNLNYTNIIVSFGIVEDANGFHFSAGSFSLGTSTPNYNELFRTVEDVEPYVDFTWSDFDQSNGILYVLARHEDDPVDMPMQLFVFNYMTAKYSIVQLALTDIYSSFLVDTRKMGSLFAFTPGPVDTSGLVNNPKWQVVSIDTTSGAITPYLSAPTDVNQYPIFWGGGVRGFCNSKYMNSPDSTTLHFLSTSGPGYPHPHTLLGLAFNLTAGAITELKTIPFYYNLVLVG